LVRLTVLDSESDTEDGPEIIRPDGTSCWRLRV